MELDRCIQVGKLKANVSAKITDNCQINLMTSVSNERGVGVDIFSDLTGNILEVGETFRSVQYFNTAVAAVSFILDVKAKMQRLEMKKDILEKELIAAMEILKEKDTVWENCGRLDK